MSLHQSVMMTVGKVVVCAGGVGNTDLYIPTLNLCTLSFNLYSDLYFLRISVQHGYYKHHDSGHLYVGLCMGPPAMAAARESKETSCGWRLWSINGTLPAKCVSCIGLA